MRRLSIALLSLLTMSQVAVAATSLNASVFTDVRDSATRSVLKTLVERGIVKSAEKFYPNRKVNRAEMAKMVVKAAFPDTVPGLPQSACFADVDIHAWYAPSICHLKAGYFVQGYRIPGSKARLFKPAQFIRYEEAMSVLVNSFSVGGCAVNGDSSGVLEPPMDCLLIANTYNLDLIRPASPVLTRADAARLIELFVRFTDCMDAAGTWNKDGCSSVTHPSSSSSSSSRSSSSSSSSSSQSSANSTSSMAGTNDQYGDTGIHSQFLLLGDVSPVLGAAKVFLYEEPMQIEDILVTLMNESSTIDSLLVFDGDRRLLGRARLDPSAITNRTYKLSLPAGTLTVPQRGERTVYVRAQMKTRENGGVSNETVQISTFSIRGHGGWSSSVYTKDSTETFLAFKTSRGRFTQIRNAGPATSPLVFGTQRVIGDFEFTGMRTDSTARTDLRQLQFTIGQTGGVQLANVGLRAEGIDEKYPCTVSASMVTCSSIPEPYGSVSDAPRRITVYGDVSIGPVTTAASLRLTLNEPGNITVPGAVSWYDGTTVFEWTGMIGPVAEGTYWKY